jgi:DNA polymerase elongation subunit (family B)
MVKFYTNVYSRGDKIYLRGYSSDNRRVHDVVDYKPYLFVPKRREASTHYRTLDNKPVEKMHFESISEARNFAKRYSDVANMEIYGLNNFRYLYIYDKFHGELDYDPTWINVISIDIETDSSDGFPDITKADKEITAITLSRRGEKVVFGYYDYKPKNDRVEYIKCKDEYHLLNNFLKIWQSGRYMPDILTGWNIEFFDLPYIVNRIKNILGVHEAKKLSPWGILEERTVETHGRENQVYYPAGISVLDYLNLYKKFKFEQQESYKLESIAEVEKLPVKKLDYKTQGYTSLDDLYRRNFELFIDYNIQDTTVIDLLEDKLKFIDQVIAFAYDAKVNYGDVLTTVLPWDIIIHNYLLDRAIVIPQFKKGDFSESLVGGYVKEVKPGMYKWPVSFDLNSLYPHLIMQYNISPETKGGREPYFPTIDSILDQYAVIEDNGFAYAANGVRFSKEKQGFLPALMEKMYNDRTEFKKKMLEAKRELEELPAVAPDDKRREITNRIARYHNLQLAKKIQLNSAYGALANEYFRWFDFDLAEAITMSGQLSIRWVERAINLYLNSLMKTKDVDYVIASDTDSIYVHMERLVKVLGATDRDKIVEALHQFCKTKMQNVINKSYSHLAEYMHAYSQKMNMKRETIADKGIWKARKMYIMNALDIEDVRYTEPQLKVMGIEAVRSSTPKACRASIKEALKLIMSSDEEVVQKYISEFKETFMKLPFEDVAFPRGMKNMDKYRDRNTVYSKGTPIHVKGALLFNHMLIKNGLDKKYQMIGDGDKIKFSYLKVPNSVGDHVIAVLDELPKELDLHKYVDYDTQFQKAFLEPIKSILEVIGWQHEKVSNLEDFFS